MKTKLFSLFIALFMVSVSANAQTSAKTKAFAVISLIGPGTPGGDWSTDSDLSTLDGETYTAVDMQFTAADIKFRQNHCWETCPGNPAGWGPTTSSSTGWPTGSNTAPVAMGPNIQCPGGVWTVTFKLSTQSWSFVAGTPNPVIKIKGSAVTGSPLTMSTGNGVQYTYKKVSLVPGTCQFDINGSVFGGTTFPGGTADNAASFIPVTTTGIDYDVTFDYATAAYTFAVATFPKIAIIGAGTAGGWPSDPQVDANAMTTTDGVTYTLKGVALKDGAIKFRQDNGWANNWGGTTFPTGPNGSADIAAVAGNYDVTFNKTTGAYTFTLNTLAIVGAGVGGWPAGTPGEVDPHTLSTVDGVNYTLSGLVVVGGGVKFRQNNAWTANWGGTAFPTGTTSGSDIVSVAGTYDLTFNLVTGAYDFGTPLAVKNFNALSLSVYPNPSNSSWNITSGNDTITSVHVFDMLGKSVYSKNTSSKDVDVNASSLSKGVYFAKVSSANGTSTVKLIKE